MNVGFTGTQIGMTEKQKEVISKVFCGLSKLGSIEFHHGDCIGADFDADQIIRLLGVIYSVILHPPINKGKRAWCDCDILRDEKEYLTRNHDIVDESSVLIACPKGFTEELRSGTWATIRYAKRKNKRVCIIWPDGTLDT